MKTAAKVILILALVLGSIGGLSRIAPIVLADSIKSAVKAGASRAQGFPQIEEYLAAATDRSLTHVLEVTVNIVLVVAGGVLGLLAVSADTSRLPAIILSAITICIGVGLIPFRSWIPAGLLAMGGFLALLAANQENTSDRPTSGGASG